MILYKSTRFSDMHQSGVSTGRDHNGSDQIWRNNNMSSKIVVTVLSTILAVMVMTEVATAHKAHSFQHYHGPVHGHHQKITWKDKHGHHHHDYVAEPHYKFSYGVHDEHTKDQHGHSEHHDGKHVTGEYTIHEPGGNVRTVKYHVDKHGFHAHVHNSGPTHHHH